MVCSCCGERPAQSYLIRTAEGEKKLFLCPKCHAELYPEREPDDIFGFLNKVGDRQKTCPACGITLDDFRRTGLLGCAHCYTAFREELLPTVRYIQGKLRHEGLQQPSAGAAARYDGLRGLANEQAALQERIREAERSGDGEAVRALKARLSALKRRLRGEDV